MKRPEIEKLDKEYMVDYIVLNEHIKGAWYISMERKPNVRKYTLSVKDNASRWERIRAWWYLLTTNLS